MIERYHFSVAFRYLNFFTNYGYLGLVWYILDGLAFFFIFIVLRGRIVDTEFLAYPIYLYSGIMVFNLLRKSISQSINISTPSKVIHVFFMHFFEVLLLAFLVVGTLGFEFDIFYKISLYLILILILFTPIYSLCRVCNLLFRINENFKNVILMSLRFLWVLTPIFYVLPDSHIINKINPIAFFISIVRDVFLEGRLYFMDFIIVCLFSTLVFVCVRILKKILDKYEIEF